MEFPSLGSRCSVSSCQQLDLLPISCSYCSQKFCKTHFQPFDHLCPSQAQSLPRTSNEISTELHSCSLADCSTKELVQMPCSHCKLHFCLQHHHQVDHQCLKLQKPQEKMVQTAALIKQIQIKNSGKKACQGVKSEKLAAKVQLMKLKQQSKGVDELPAEERIYFAVHTPSDKHEAVFVSKFWSVGKCIDYIASACQIANFNNVAGKPHLNLFTSSGMCLSENKDLLISQMIDDEVIFNGQTINLKYVGQ